MILRAVGLVFVQKSEKTAHWFAIFGRVVHLPPDGVKTCPVGIANSRLWEETYASPFWVPSRKLPQLSPMKIPQFRILQLVHFPIAQFVDSVPDMCTRVTPQSTPRGVCHHPTLLIYDDLCPPNAITVSPPKRSKVNKAESQHSDRDKTVI